MYSTYTEDWTLFARINGNEIFEEAYVVWEKGVFIISFPGILSS